MSKRIKVIAALAVSAVAVAGILFGLASKSLRTVEPFYAEALEIEPAKLEDASEEMESRVAALYSDAQPPGAWSAMFSDGEINGWLAVALAEKFPDLLPPEVRDPRVAFIDGGVLVGFRLRGERLDAIASIHLEPVMASEDVLAVRLRSARVGVWPLPPAKVVEYVTEGAAQLELPLKWADENGDPVALLPTANWFSTETERRQLDLVEARDGELMLSGKTLPQTNSRRTAGRKASIRR